jgi:VanZ family protein
MALCWLPGIIVNRIERGSGWFQIPDLDKVVHAGIFVIFSVLWLRVVSARNKYLLVGVAGIMLAALTELVQNLPIVGRDGSIEDTITDIAGAVAGLAIAPLVEPLLRYLETRLFRDSTS